MTMDNAKIRKIILVEHEGLRGGLRSIEALLGKHESGDPAALAIAHQELKNFVTGFLRHIEHEERILEPVLAVIDAWGPQRKQAMDEEHAMQRELVGRLAKMEPSSNVVAWLHEVRTFMTDLYKDMADEERTCLSPNVLRDDVVVVDGDSE